MTTSGTAPDDEWFEAAPFGVLAVTDGVVKAANDIAKDLLELDSPVGDTIAEAFPAAVDRKVPDVFATDGPRESRQFNEYYPGLDQWLAVTVEPVSEGVIVYVDQVTEQIHAEQEVDQLSGELDRIATISELLSAVLSRLVNASTRDEIAETICDQLGEIDRYAFAWFGERDPTSDQLEIRASAGVTGETFDRLRDHLESSPERQAMEAGSIEIVDSFAADERLPKAVRRAAFADGVQSSLAVPLVYGETVYGVVSVYATQRDAFSARAEESFEMLGTVAGFAVDAIRNRNLLASNSVTAFTFDVSDPDAPFSAASAATDATLTVDGTAPPDREYLTCYLSIAGAAPEAVADWLRSHQTVATVRVLGAHETTGRIEVEIGAETPLHTIVSLGASVATARFEQGTGRVTAELPSAGDVDVRRLAETLRRQFSIEAVSTVRRDRSPTTTQEFRTELDERLTGRQTDALRTAYLAGYFKSPRDSTAAEVGAALDITGSTLLHHLRAGQEKLLDTYLDVDSNVDGPAGTELTAADQTDSNQ
ncbi:bacterio-opsin activator domain-containing protein [Halorubrum sp. RMP-47]|uniref:bacterio-opsin activator domain-containing protein n=1 Tax=Halorubrum miltondacostae TaxID=3076378 RepID=UPI003529418A